MKNLVKCVNLKKKSKILYNIYVKTIFTAILKLYKKILIVKLTKRIQIWVNLRKVQSSNFKFLNKKKLIIKKYLARKRLFMKNLFYCDTNREKG